MGAFADDVADIEILSVILVESRVGFGQYCPQFGRVMSIVAVRKTLSQCLSVDQLGLGQGFAWFAF